MKFNPLRYSSSEDYSSDREETVEKGHKNLITVDIGKFEDICKKFRDHPDIKIKKLSGQDKEDFEVVISYVQLLYGTEYYKDFHSIVKKYFKKVTVKPGTVGGYFAGCLNKSGDGSCSVNCVGSMPLPKDEQGWHACDKAVILGERNGDTYNFNLVKPADNDNDEITYVFIETNNLHDFSGFTKEEKNELKKLGCKKIKLVGYKADGTSYSDLYDEPTEVDVVKHRKSFNGKKSKAKENFTSHGSHSSSDDQNNHWGMWLALGIFVILILIILMLLGYKYYKFRY